MHALETEIAFLQGGLVTGTAALIGDTDLTAVIPGLGAPPHILLFKAAH